VFITANGDMDPYLCTQTFYCEISITSDNLSEFKGKDVYIGKSYDLADGIKTKDVTFD
jgi:hypothetical protein